MATPEELNKQKAELQHHGREAVRLGKVVVGAHKVWWWKVLWEARAWEFMIPWPLNWIINRVTNRGGRGNLGLTLSAIVAIPVYQFASHHIQTTWALVAEAAKIEFSAAFLLGTILSVSVSLPGANILKGSMRKPKFAIDFVVPFMWALMWGVAGATGLLFFKVLPDRLRSIALFFGVFGAFMELNALIHTMRMYLIGLLLESEKTLKREFDAVQKEIDKVPADTPKDN